MKDNANVKIIGHRVILIPYEAKHVAKYHGWMENEELRTLTASERLTLDEEFKMQRTWRESEDKCCFLIMCRETFERQDDEIAALVGDTNLFLTQDEGGSPSGGNGQKRAEVEIMIAEKWARGKGYGREAILLMLKYGVHHLHVKLFFAKIGLLNHISLRMFEQMHFEEEGRSTVFQEVTMMRPVTEEWLKWLDEYSPALRMEAYHQEAAIS